jgi:hypothetical protein
MTMMQLGADRNESRPSKEDGISPLSSSVGDDADLFIMAGEGTLLHLLPLGLKGSD